MKKGWSTVSGLLSALGVGAGATGLLGGSARFAASMVPYRPFFILLTFAFLGLGLYSVYRREPVCDDASACSPERLKRTKRWLWVIAVISLILTLSPYLLAIGS